MSLYVVKAISLVAALIGSILLTLGGSLWVVGLVTLACSLGLRGAFALASISSEAKAASSQGQSVKESGSTSGKLPATSPGPSDTIAEAARHAGGIDNAANLAHRPEKVEEEQTATPTKRTTPSILAAKIAVVGVGGGGCATVDRMYRDKLPGIDYIVVNTDKNSLSRSEVPISVLIGDRLVKGRGVGGDPELGRQAAEEGRGELEAVLEGNDIVFVTAGMGGGTGTGAAMVVAELSQHLGALTIGIVTRPFNVEGAARRRIAEEGIARLKNHVDALIVISNDRLMDIVDPKTTVAEAFKLSDDVVRQGVQAIVELVINSGDINLDFADLRAVLGNAGPAWIGIGWGKGEDRAYLAAQAAISSPLLEVSVEGARSVLFNITGGSYLTLEEVQRAAEVISHAVDPDASIMFGMVMDPKMEDEVKVTIIATGFPIAGHHGARANDVDRLIAEALSPQESTTQDLDIPPFLRRVPRGRERSL